jgi:hypothetical protein
MKRGMTYEKLAQLLGDFLPPDPEESREQFIEENFGELLNILLDKERWVIDINEADTIRKLITDNIKAFVLTFMANCYWVASDEGIRYVTTETYDEVLGVDWVELFDYTGAPIATTVEEYDAVTGEVLANIMAAINLNREKKAVEMKGGT